MQIIEQTKDRLKPHWKRLQIHDFVTLPYLDATKVWRKIQYESLVYFVSEHGDVYSMNRERILKGQTRQIFTQRYRQVNIRGQWFSLHILVLICHGPVRPSTQHECNHKDNNGENCHISNLEWLTHGENIKHSFNTTRKTVSGSDHWNYGKPASDETRQKMSASKKLMWEAKRQASKPINT